MASVSSSASLESKSQALQEAFQACQSDSFPTCKVQVGMSSSCHRLGLFATQAISKGDVIVNTPFDDRLVITASVAKKQVFNDVLTDDYDGWTGDAGLLAMMILNEMARMTGKGTDRPVRSGSAGLSSFVRAWLLALPRPEELKNEHPLLWSEADQEVLQSSSTTKIYRTLDDIEEDFTWWKEQVFASSKDRFPETITLESGETLPCFSLEGFTWAMALVQSRSVFLDGSLRLLPWFDMANHDDAADELTTGSMGRFKTIRGAQWIAHQAYAPGDEVFCSYGPKSAAEYILEHGFGPPSCWKKTTARSELTFEVDSQDRFYDDKLDILEYETYDLAPMDPVQSFDVANWDGEPDPAMMQFLRLVHLKGTDAFLLESIFRREVWGFMALPVSEQNESNVIQTICDACQKALDEFESIETEDQENSENPRLELCRQLRESESRALTRTLEYLQREKEALDLKEYYQERRLKDLGLDSEWTPEDDPDLGFGQTRAPGGADYDW